MSEDLLRTAVNLHEAGNLAAAAELYVRILRAQPQHLEVLYRLSLIHLATNRFSDAEQLLSAALRINPNIPEILYVRGCALQGMSRHEDALASFARALALRPDYIEARNNLGVTLLDLKRFAEALACFESLNVSGDYANALVCNNRAAALLGLRRYQEALTCIEKSLALLPDRPNSLSTYAATLMGLERYEEALANYDRALQLQPDFVDAFSNRGSALRELNRLEEALESYDRAVQVKPDYAEALNNRGMLRLLIGRFGDGWADHEWRWQANNLPKPAKIIGRPWRGEDLRGRSIAVYSEQGLGDVIQFVRYLPLLIERGAVVSLFVPENLIRLLRPFSPPVTISASTDDRVSFDFQCALMSLPLWFRTDLSSIPNAIPYLTAENDLVARWNQKLGSHGFKIGIAWQGKPGGPIDQGRSIPLAEFAPLAKIAGVRLISLQKTHGLDQLKRLPADTNIETFGEEFDSGSDAFVDTAAVMRNLDLIITSDTSIAHLAGALGRPTWIALKQVPDWRWLLERDDSPWYPTVRLFRQQTAGDWKSVFTKIDRELRSLASR